MANTISRALHSNRDAVPLHISDPPRSQFLLLLANRSPRTYVRTPCHPAQRSSAAFHAADQALGALNSLPNASRWFLADLLRGLPRLKAPDRYNNSVKTRGYAVDENRHDATANVVCVQVAIATHQQISGLRLLYSVVPTTYHSRSYFCLFSNGH